MRTSTSTVRTRERSRQRRARVRLTCRLRSLDGADVLDDRPLLKAALKANADVQQRVCAFFYHDYVCGGYELPAACAGPTAEWLPAAMQRLMDDAPVAPMDGPVEVVRFALGDGQVICTINVPPSDGRAEALDKLVPSHESTRHASSQALPKFTPAHLDGIQIF